MPKYIHPKYSFKKDPDAFAQAEIQRVIIERHWRGNGLICTVVLTDSKQTGKLRLNEAQRTLLTETFGSPLDWIGRFVSITLKRVLRGKREYADLMLIPILEAPNGTKSV